MAMEIFTVGRGQEGYPERLMPFADMPSRLFVRGALPADEQKTAAIVGYLLSETELPADAADAGKRRRCLKRISSGRRAASVAFPDPQPRDQCAGRCRSGN